MDQPDREAEPQFSQPVRQVILMLIASGLAVVAAIFAAPSVLPIFQSNPYLNGFIAFVFLGGVVACFWQVGQLIASVRWIESFTRADAEAETGRAPQLLAPLATLLRARSKRMQLSSTSTSSILDSVSTRIEEAREITRYLVSLLIFLGLLGTFYGLATTVPAVVDTIRSLTPQEGEQSLDVFNRLMQGLEAQLGGMGVAFGSSLLGLTGSLVVGLLELFAGHGQNRFYRELEEWLSTITRVGLSSAEGEGGADTHLLSGIIDTMNEQIEALQYMFARSDESRALTDDKMGHLVSSVERLTHRLGDQSAMNDTMLRVAQGQDSLIQHLRQTQGSEAGIDAESRMRLRSIDVQMLRILEEISAGRQETMAELRTDIAALGRTLVNAPVRQSRPGGNPPPRKPPEREG